MQMPGKNNASLVKSPQFPRLLTKNSLVVRIKYNCVRFLQKSSKISAVWSLASQTPYLLKIHRLTMVCIILAQHEKRKLRGFQNENIIHRKAYTGAISDT